MRKKEIKDRPILVHKNKNIYNMLIIYEEKLHLNPPDNSN